jgi:hydrogenase nickel incorporation protein HypB
MCRDCGCSLGPEATRAPFAARTNSSLKIETIEVITAILGENDRVAAHNREHFDEHGVLALNLMSSPGAGKTSLLEATIRALDGRLRVAVIEATAFRTTPTAPRLRIPAVRSRPAMPATSMRRWCTTPRTTCRSPISTCCSSRTSATSSARRASTLASTAT